MFVAIGLFSVFALLVEGWISRNSDGSLIWEIAIGAKNVPVGVSWIILGFILLRSSVHRS